MSDIQLHELCGHYPQLRSMSLPLDQIVRGSCKLLRLRELVPKLRLLVGGGVCVPLRRLQRCT